MSITLRGMLNPVVCSDNAQYAYVSNNDGPGCITVYYDKDNLSLAKAALRCYIYIPAYGTDNRYIYDTITTTTSSNTSCTAARYLAFPTSGYMRWGDWNGSSFATTSSRAYYTYGTNINETSYNIMATTLGASSTDILRAIVNSMGTSNTALYGNYSAAMLTANVVPYQCVYIRPLSTADYYKFMASHTGKLTYPGVRSVVPPSVNLKSSDSNVTVDGTYIHYYNHNAYVQGSLTAAELTELASKLTYSLTSQAVVNVGGTTVNYPATLASGIANYTSNNVTGEFVDTTATSVANQTITRTITWGWSSSLQSDPDVSISYPLHDATYTVALHDTATAEAFEAGLDYGDFTDTDFENVADYSDGLMTFSGNLDGEYTGYFPDRNFSWAYFGSNTKSGTITSQTISMPSSTGASVFTSTNSSINDSTGSYLTLLLETCSVPSSNLLNPYLNGSVQSLLILLRTPDLNKSSALLSAFNALYSQTTQEALINTGKLSATALKNQIRTNLMNAANVSELSLMSKFFETPYVIKRQTTNASVSIKASDVMGYNMIYRGIPYGQQVKVKVNSTGAEINLETLLNAYGTATTTNTVFGEHTYMDTYYTLYRDINDAWIPAGTATSANAVKKVVLRLNTYGVKIPMRDAETGSQVLANISPGIAPGIPLSVINVNQIAYGTRMTTTNTAYNNVACYAPSIYVIESDYSGANPQADSYMFHCVIRADITTTASDTSDVTYSNVTPVGIVQTVSMKNQAVTQLTSGTGYNYAHYKTTYTYPFPDNITLDSTLVSADSEAIKVRNTVHFYGTDEHKTAGIACDSGYTKDTTVYKTETLPDDTEIIPVSAVNALVRTASDTESTMLTKLQTWFKNYVQSWNCTTYNNHEYGVEVIYPTGIWHWDTDSSTDYIYAYGSGTSWVARYSIHSVEALNSDGDKNIIIGVEHFDTAEDVDIYQEALDNGDSYETAFNSLKTGNNRLTSYGDGTYSGCGYDEYWQHVELEVGPLDVYKATVDVSQETYNKNSTLTEITSTLEFSAAELYMTDGTVYSGTDVAVDTTTISGITAGLLGTQQGRVKVYLTDDNTVYDYAKFTILIGADGGSANEIGEVPVPINFADAQAAMMGFDDSDAAYGDEYDKVYGVYRDLHKAPHLFNVSAAAKIKVLREKYANEIQSLKLANLLDTIAYRHIKAMALIRNCVSEASNSPQATTIGATEKYYGLSTSFSPYLYGFSTTDPLVAMYVDEVLTDQLVRSGDAAGTYVFKSPYVENTAWSTIYKYIMDGLEDGTYTASTYFYFNEVPKAAFFDNEATGILTMAAPRP